MRVDTARAAVLSLLAEREPEASICPSDVARKLAAADDADWRVIMPLVHRAVDRLVDQHGVRLSWKGSVLSARTGPYRIGRGDTCPSDGRENLAK